MSDANLDALDPAPLGQVKLGDGSVILVKPLKLGKLPAFARALEPVAGEIDKLLATGLNAQTVMALLGSSFDKLLDALEIATGASRKALEESDIEQGLELVLAVLQANRNFFKGRAATALRLAAVISGPGPTQSKPSLAAAAAGVSTPSSASRSTS